MFRSKKSQDNPSSSNPTQSGATSTGAVVGASQPGASSVQPESSGQPPSTTSINPGDISGISPGQPTDFSNASSVTDFTPTPPPDDVPNPTIAQTPIDQPAEDFSTQIPVPPAPEDDFSSQPSAPAPEPGESGEPQPTDQQPIEPPARPEDNTPNFG